METKFVILRSKILEGLASVQDILAKESISRVKHVLVDSDGHYINSRAAFLNGLVEEYNSTHHGDCPICGGRVHSVLNDDWEEVDVCENCKNEVTDLADKKLYHVSEHGMAEFVRKQLGFRFAQRLGGGNYRLGMLHGKKAFFCVSPKHGFYNAHNKDSVFFLCNVESVPEGWTANGCHAIPFAELFYEKSDGVSIGMAEDVLNDLKPKVPERRFGEHRRIHERRDDYLSVVMNILTSPYNAKDFKRGMITPTALAKWHRKLFKDASPKSRKTFERDLNELRFYDPKKDAYDKRQSHIVSLFEYAASPNNSQEDRLKIADCLKDALTDLQAKTRRAGKPIELPQWGWITGADGKSERVPVVSATSMYEEVDQHLKNDKESAAA